MPKKMLTSWYFRTLFWLSFGNVLGRLIDALELESQYIYWTIWDYRSQIPMYLKNSVLGKAAFQILDDKHIEYS